MPWRAVLVVTADPGAARSPECRTASGRVKEYVTTHPADVAHGQDRVMVAWVKRRRGCWEPSCPRKSFTESLPAIPPRCRVTARLREHAATLVAEGGPPVRLRASDLAAEDFPTPKWTIQPQHGSTQEHIVPVFYGQGLQSWPPDAELTRYARKAGVGLLSGTWWQNSSACRRRSFPDPGHPGPAGWLEVVEDFAEGVLLADLVAGELEDVAAG